MPPTTYQAKFKATTVTIADGNNDGVFQNDQDKVEIKTTLATGSKTPDPEAEAGYNPARQLDLIMKSDATRLNGLRIKTLNEFIGDMNRAAVAAEKCDSATAFKYVEEAREDAREGKFIGLFGPTLPKMESHIAALQGATQCQPGAVTGTATTTQAQAPNDIIKILPAKDDISTPAYGLRLTNIDDPGFAIDANSKFVLVSLDEKKYPLKNIYTLQTDYDFFIYAPAILIDSLKNQQPYPFIGKSTFTIQSFLTDTDLAAGYMAQHKKIPSDCYEKIRQDLAGLGIEKTPTGQKYLVDLKKYVGSGPAAAVSTTTSPASTATSNHTGTLVKNR